MITAAHGFGNCGDYIDGQSAWQGPYEYLIGDVGKWDWHQDWALIYETSNKEIDGLNDRIVNESYDAIGHMTEDGVDDLASGADDRSVRKYGARTCHTAGVDVDKVSWAYCDNTHKWVDTYDANSDNGDSGCPHFVKYQYFDAISIVGMHHGHDIRSIAAFEISDKHSIEFGDNPTC